MDKMTWAPSAEDKRRARQKLNYEIAAGRVQRGEFCELCGSDNVEGHHKDYTRPLDVQWLCKTCHAIIEGVEADNARELLELSTEDYRTQKDRHVAAFN